MSRNLSISSRFSTYWAFHIVNVCGIHWCKRRSSRRHHILLREYTPPFRLTYFITGIIQPYSHIFGRIIHVNKYTLKHIHSRQFKTALFSIVILIPLVLFVLGQLSAIDGNFADLTTHLWRFIFQIFNTMCFHRIIWLKNK